MWLFFPLLVNAGQCFSNVCFYDHLFLIMLFSVYSMLVHTCLCLYMCLYFVCIDLIAFMSISTKKSNDTFKICYFLQLVSEIAIQYKHFYM